MSLPLKNLKALIAELKRTKIHILSIENFGEVDEEPYYSITQLEINGIDSLRYPNYIDNLYKMVIEEKVLVSLKHKQSLEYELKAIRNDFTTTTNTSFDSIQNPNLVHSVRRTMEVSYSKDSEPMSVYSKPSDIVQMVLAHTEVAFQTLIEVIDGLLLELSIKVPVPRMEGFFSFEYRGSPTSDKLRHLHDILLEKKRIKEIQWKYFRWVFSRDTRTEVEVKIVWLAGISELKKLIDTLIDSNQFKAKTNKWKVASHCFIINDKPTFDWSTMRSQKHPIYTPSYIEEIKNLFDN